MSNTQVHAEKITTKRAYLEAAMLHGSGGERNQSATRPDDLDGLKGLIAKLRWAGMDQDAEKLCHELECKAPADCVPPGPLETD